MECLESDRISAPCHECIQEGKPVHVVGRVTGHLRGRPISETRFYCRKCCPVHRQAEIDWATPPAPTTAGEQGGLF